MSGSLRRTGIGLVFLIVGAIVSIAVAWGLPIALTPSPTKPLHATMAWGPAQDRKSEWWMVSVYNTFAADSQQWNWYGTQAEATKQSNWYINWGHIQAAQEPTWRTITQAEFSLPYWSAIHHDDLDHFDPALIPAGAITPPDRCYSFWEGAQGWPFRCVRCTQLTADGPSGNPYHYRNWPLPLYSTTCRSLHPYPAGPSGRHADLRGGGSHPHSRCVHALMRSSFGADAAAFVPAVPTTAMASPMELPAPNAADNPGYSHSIVAGGLLEMS